jgi:hypothetical protein
MLFHYLVRRIHPSNSQFPATCQLVYCHWDRDKVERCQSLVQKDPKLGSLVNVSYSIERHSSSTSGKDLERQSLLNHRRKEAAAAARARDNDQVWVDPSDMQEYDEEMMSEPSMV